MKDDLEAEKFVRKSLSVFSKGEIESHLERAAGTMLYGLWARKDKLIRVQREMDYLSAKQIV